MFISISKDTVITKDMNNNKQTWILQEGELSFRLKQMHTTEGQKEYSPPRASHRSIPASGFCILVIFYISLPLLSTDKRVDEIKFYPISYVITYEIHREIWIVLFLQLLWKYFCRPWVFNPGFHLLVGHCKC